MNVENLFKAIREEPDESTLIVVVTELENQGYSVVVNETYKGLEQLQDAEDRGELDLVPASNGYVVSISKGKESERFRIQLLDVDTICVTDVECSPVMLNPDYTTRFFESGETN